MMIARTISPLKSASQSRLAQRCDVDAIRAAIDQSWRRKSARIRRDYGRAMAAMRRAHGIRQNEVAGFSERQLRRIEQTGALSVSALEKLAKAHRMRLASWLSLMAEFSLNIHV